MLRSLKGLESYRVSAQDGEIGTAVDFLVEDDRWTVRYLVVETGSIFTQKRVLISPISFGQADWATHHFNVNLTIAKVKGSPSLDLDQPVSRREESTHHRYYGYPYYWGYTSLWGESYYPDLLAADAWRGVPGEDFEAAPGDSHLRSAKEIVGYHIQASDDSLGHLADLIVDDRSWEIRYLAVASAWWLGRKVLIAPHWASRVDWAERKVHVDMTKESIRRSPVWHETEGVNREYEAKLYDYYGRPSYWANPKAPTSRVATNPGAAHLR